MTIKTIARRYVGQLETMIAELEGERDKAQDAFDAKSEKWQEGDKGEAASEAIDQIQSAIDSLEEAKNSLEEAQGEA